MSQSLSSLQASEWPPFVQECFRDCIQKAYFSMSRVGQLAQTCSAEITLEYVLLYIAEAGKVRVVVGLNQQVKLNVVSGYMARTCSCRQITPFPWCVLNTVLKRGYPAVAAFDFILPCRRKNVGEDLGTMFILSSYHEIYLQPQILSRNSLGCCYSISKKVVSTARENN